MSSRSSSPYSTSVVDPSNGNAIWSYKGNELNGVGSNLVEPVGVFGDYFAMLPAGRPFIYFITARKATVTTSLSGRPDSVRISRTGKLAFVLVNSKVHCYNVNSRFHYLLWGIDFSCITGSCSRSHQIPY